MWKFAEVLAVREIHSLGTLTSTQAVQSLCIVIKLQHNRKTRRPFKDLSAILPPALLSRTHIHTQPWKISSTRVVGRYVYNTSPSASGLPPPSTTQCEPLLCTPLRWNNYSPSAMKEKTHCTTATVCKRLCNGTFSGANWIFITAVETKLTHTHQSSSVRTSQLFRRARQLR